MRLEQWQTCIVVVVMISGSRKMRVKVATSLLKCFHERTHTQLVWAQLLERMAQKRREFLKAERPGRPVANLFKTAFYRISTIRIVSRTKKIFALDQNRRLRPLREWAGGNVWFGNAESI